MAGSNLVDIPIFGATTTRDTVIYSSDIFGTWLRIPILPGQIVFRSVPTIGLIATMVSLGHRTLHLYNDITHAVTSYLGKVRKHRHSRLWEMIFRDQAWLVKATEAKLNPVLIGSNLQSLYSSHQKIKPGYLCLFTDDITGDFTVSNPENVSLFFQCLRQFTYDASTEEVKLCCGITLDVSEIVGTGALKTIPSRLFSYSFGNLRSSYLFWNDYTHSVRQVRPRQIYGIHGVAEDMADVTDWCQVRLFSPYGRECNPVFCGPKPTGAI